MQPAPSATAMDALRMLVPLAVCGAFAAKLVLDWTSGRKAVQGGDDPFDSGSDGCNDGHDGGWCGGDDGGGGH